FTASWCVYCKRMEKTTFTDRQVVQRVQSSFVPVRIDADRHKELVQKLEVRGLPAILIVSPDLRIIDRISGFQTPEALIQKLDVVIAGLRQNGAGAPPIASRPRNTVPPAHA
ncbi:MAG: thioredoxin fold domain-containing protein, partial [Phycisphaerae bacterium]